MVHRVRPLPALAAVLLALAAVTAPPVPAQSPAIRIGYVDMKRLLDNAPQVVAGRQQLTQEFAARDAGLKADEARLAELEKKRAAATGADSASLQREIDALSRSLKRTRETLRAELKARSDQELDTSWRQINEAVVDFAREKGYDLILPSPVIFAGPRVDVTDQVLDQLRRQYQSTRGGNP
ncbi:MAG: OmpH family outer membrane protein [Lysobacterales bacterium]